MGIQNVERQKIKVCADFSKRKISDCLFFCFFAFFLGTISPFFHLFERSLCFYLKWIIFLFQIAALVTFRFWLFDCEANRIDVIAIRLWHADADTNRPPFIISSFHFIPRMFRVVCTVLCPCQRRYEWKTNCQHNKSHTLYHMLPSICAIANAFARFSRYPTSSLPMASYCLTHS